MGQKGEKKGKKKAVQPRHIVAKFHNFKDRESVRRCGKELKGTEYCVFEQFPNEIVEIRRKLVPKLKDAQKEGKRAWISYDTLYIDGSPVKA